MQKKWDRIFKNEKIRGGYCIMLDNIRQKFPLFSDLKINLIILCAFVIICIYFIYNLVGKNSKGKAVLIQGLLLILLFVAGIFIVGVLYELLISLFSLNVYMKYVMKSVLILLVMILCFIMIKRGK